MLDLFFIKKLTFPFNKTKTYSWLNFEESNHKFVDIFNTFLR